MQTPPEMRREPTSAKVSSQDSKSGLHSAFNEKDTLEPVHLQARHIRDRFGVSWPLAVHVAELAFPAGRAA